MSGPIIRTGSNPKIWSNWDRIFGNKSEAEPKATTAKAGKKATKKAAKKAVKTAVAAPKAVKKATKKAAKKAAKKAK